MRPDVTYGFRARAVRKYAMAEVTPTLSTGQTRRVLVVDDDPEVLRATQRLILSLGYDADTCANAACAVKLAAVRDYDVVVTDLVMPNLDGIGLMTVLRRQLAVSSFVLITGSSDWGERSAPNLDGRLACVLQKPLEECLLANALGHALQLADTRRRLLTQEIGGLRVLLVEDSETDALLLEHHLNLLGGYRVTHVDRLSEAVRALHDEHFDMVITDLTLPDARGLDAVLRLRECDADVLLLVCSATPDEALALQVISLGAQDFIVKNELEPESLGRTIRFASVRRESERKLAVRAHTDPLTGLWNRAALGERLQQMLAQAKRHQSRLAVLYLDLDGFKAINDTYGHDAGDTVLKESAQRLRSCVRDYDVIARLGGDEFAIVTTGTDYESATVTAERVALAISAPFALGGCVVSVTTSIGLATFPETADEPAILLKLADEAMYAAKHSGKNQLRYAGSRS